MAQQQKIFLAIPALASCGFNRVKQQADFSISPLSSLVEAQWCSDSLVCWGEVGETE